MKRVLMLGIDEMVISTLLSDNPNLEIIVSDVLNQDIQKKYKRISFFEGPIYQLLDKQFDFIVTNRPIDYKEKCWLEAFSHQGDLPTLVTCLYDLNKYDKERKFTISDYLKLAEWYSELDVPMIIFVSPDSIEYETLKKVRSKQPKTKFYCLELENIPSFAYLDRLEEMSKKFVIENANQSKDTPRAVCLWNAKLDFLEIAIKDNPFKTDRFVWIDIGIKKVAKEPLQIMSWLKNVPAKIKHLNIEAYNPQENERDFFRWVYHHIAGGLFSGSVENLEWYISEFKKKWIQILDEGWWQMEEALYTMIAFKHPDRFEFYYGDYETIISNYNHPIDMIPYILNLVPKYLNFRNYNMANSILDYLESVCLQSEVYRDIFVRLTILTRYYRDGKLGKNILIELKKDWTETIRKNETKNLAFYSDYQENSQI